ncbi:MAG: hypothetical protein AAFV69_15115, partial [Pseudomonadota bacterium]
ASSRRQSSLTTNGKARNQPPRPSTPLLEMSRRLDADQIKTQPITNELGASRTEIAGVEEAEAFKWQVRWQRLWIRRNR